MERLTTNIKNEEDPKIKTRIAWIEQVSMAHFQLLKNAVLFDFETRKTILGNFQALGEVKSEEGDGPQVDISDIDNPEEKESGSYFLRIMVRNTHFEKFLLSVIDDSRKSEMLGFCGTLLRFLSRSQVRNRLGVLGD